MKPLYLVSILLIAIIASSGCLQETTTEQNTETSSQEETQTNAMDEELCSNDKYETTKMMIRSGGVSVTSPKQQAITLTTKSAVDLMASGNINDIKDLTCLEHLSLTDVPIGDDLSPILGMKNLVSLYLDDADLVDITPLRELTKLRYVFIKYNDVTDISVLNELPDLKAVDITGLEIPQEQIDRLKETHPDVTIYQ